MQWDDQYKRKYYEVIRDKLPRALVAVYEKNEWLHDAYLKSFYVANSGPNLHAYSARGSSTLQLEFFSSNGDPHILLIYQNVSRIQVDYQETDDVTFLSPTGFGSCMVNRFDIGEDSLIKHEYEFEGGNRILIICEKIQYRKVINAYW